MAKRKQPETPHVKPADEIYFYPVKNPLKLYPVPYENKLPLKQLTTFKIQLHDTQVKKFTGRNTRVIN